ncbi:MAG: family 10 glycosylhydrolase [Myxococcales bacterium]|nr:family 10 glycosylhydrolase [Myxococcales bacterium]MDH5306174.1 family 10 glycosylhydrolase [Myxococcales bacterium]
MLCAQLLLGCGDRAETADARGAAAPPARERSAPRALWVLAEGHQRVLDHPERVPTLIEDARLLGATDLFVQVYRGGRAWFDSRLADATPYRSVHDSSGVDTLADLLHRAHVAGLRVHAWINLLSLASNRDAPLLRSLGAGAVLVDRLGRSLLDYPALDVPAPDRRYYRMGTPGLYLDPATPGLAEHLAATCGELLLGYPELDGLHLDYVRYPDVLPFAPGSRFGVGLDFGYGEGTRQRFARETGAEAPFGSSIRNADRWDEWRRDKVTELVQTIAARARQSHPAITLSAAVWTYEDRAYLALGQDWRRWLEEGLLDVAVPMAYTRDDRLFRYQVETFANLPRGDRIWIGLGTWLFSDEPARALEQLRRVEAAGAAGAALFSYDSIVAAPALRAALIEEEERGAR